MVREGFVRECHFCWDLRTKSQPFMGQPSEECSGSRHSMCKGPVSTSCCLVAFLTFTVEASLFSTIFNEFSFYLHISHFNLMPFLSAWLACKEGYIERIFKNFPLFQKMYVTYFWLWTKSRFMVYSSVYLCTSVNSGETDATFPFLSGLFV